MVRCLHLLDLLVSNERATLGRCVDRGNGSDFHLKPRDVLRALGPVATAAVRKRARGPGALWPVLAGE
jgi:hypothetical protein